MVNNALDNGFKVLSHSYMDTSVSTCSEILYLTLYCLDVQSAVNVNLNELNSGVWMLCRRREPEICPSLATSCQFALLFHTSVKHSFSSFISRLCFAVLDKQSRRMSPTTSSSSSLSSSSSSASPFPAACSTSSSTSSTSERGSPGGREPNAGHPAGEPTGSRRAEATPGRRLASGDSRQPLSLGCPCGRCTPQTSFTPPRAHSGGWIERPAPALHACMFVCAQDTWGLQVPASPRVKKNSISFWMI